MAPISPAVNTSVHSEPTEILESDLSVVHQSGNIIRLNVPIPFFLRNDVFSTFSKPGYSWNLHDSASNNKMVLLVGSLERSKSGDDTIRTEALASSKKKPTTEYSIGGCPLECPFDLNEDFEEALAIDCIPLVFDGLRISSKYLPLHVDEGRRSIQKITSQTSPFVDDLNLVEGSDGWFDKDTLVLAFVDGYSQNSGLTLTGFRRKLRLTSLHWLGRHRSEAKVLQVDSLRKFHAQNLMVENKPVTSLVHAVYEKLHGESPSNGKVYLEYVFKEPSNIFDLPPEDCKSKIAIKPLPGDANQYMAALWSEIQDLERWMDNFSQYHPESSVNKLDMTSLLNNTVFDICDTKVSPTFQAMQNLLTQEPAADIHTGSMTDFSDSLDSVLQQVVKQERTDCDFTDKLWSIIRKCETVDELQECLHLVFQAVSNKMYRPYILLNNDSILAKVLGQVMKGDMTSLLQVRRHSVMLKMVIECGLRKLFKDYNFVLAISHLIERGGIDNFTPSISSLQDSLWKIKKLHCTLEIMCLSKERLTLSVHILEGHTKQLLKKFTESPTFSWDETYHFDVPPSDIRRIMNGLHPIYYKLRMQSQTLLKWATTTCVISLENYINYKRTAVEELNLRHYYLYVITESGRLGQSE